MSEYKYQPTWESLDSRPCPRWFSQAKFGIFIHWGVYSVPAYISVTGERYASYAEWYAARVCGADPRKRSEDQEWHDKVFGKGFEYRQFGPLFKAELFDPDQWARLFQRSGAKYVVLTSKHHDGYCLWPTKVAAKKDWHSGAVGPRRDLLGDLATAVRQQGLRMGLYYSMVEWETHTASGRLNQDGKSPSTFIQPELMKKYGMDEHEYVPKLLEPQLKELVMTYKPAVLFADAGEWGHSAEKMRTREFLSWLYNQAPNKDEVVVNDRWCEGMPHQHGDYYSSEYDDAEEHVGKADAEGAVKPWEESRGMGQSYGYNRMEALEHYKTSTQLIHQLAIIVSRGGNLLLNVGPTADGRIPVIMQQRLADIGDWLQVNGQAIYATQTVRAQPHNTTTAEAKSLPRVVCTRRDDALYLICLGWPDHTFAVHVQGVMQATAAPAPQAELLGLPDKAVSLRCSWDDHTTLVAELTPPTVSPNEVPCASAYVFKISPLQFGSSRTLALDTQAEKEQAEQGKRKKVRVSQ